MTQWLKQSTAVTVVMGPFIDDTDGKTPEIALDITEQEVLLSKNGGAFTLKGDTTHGVHDAAHNGWYTIPLSTTDTGTLGCLDIAINMAGALPCWKSYMVVTADAWDSMFGAVVIGQAGAQAALVANNLDHLCKTATASADMTTEVTDGTIISRMISNSDTSLFVPGTHSLQIVGADVAAVHVHAGTIETDVAATHVHAAAADAALANGGFTDLILDGIETHVHNIDTQVGTAGAGLTSANVGQAALVANNLDHLCKTATAGADMTTEVTDGTIISRMISNSDTSLFVPGTHSLQIVGADVAAVHVHAGTIETDVAAVHVHVGTIDGHITADYGATEKTCIDLLDDAAGGLADIHTDVGTAITNIGTVDTVVDGIETHVHAIDGRIPAALTANGNMKSSLVEILTTALTETGGYLAGAFKKFFNVAAPTGTVNSLPDAVAGAANGLFIAGTNAATTVTTALTTTFTGNLTGSVASVTALGAQAKLDVNAEVDTAFTTQVADSYAAHEALPTREQALLEILQFLTEKSVSSTTVSVRKPDGSTAVMEFTLDSATAPTSITRKANP